MLRHLPQLRKGGHVGGGQGGGKVKPQPRPWGEPQDAGGGRVYPQTGFVMDGEQEFGLLGGKQAVQLGRYAGKGFVKRVGHGGFLVDELGRGQSMGCYLKYRLNTKVFQLVIVRVYSNTVR